MYDAGSRRFPLLLTAFALLQLCDIITTNRALLLPGRSELNPIMASAIAHMGDAWWLPKVAVVAVVALTAIWAQHRSSRILMSGCYATVAILFAVVVSNLRHL